MNECQELLAQIKQSQSDAANKINEARKMINSGRVLPAFIGIGMMVSGRKVNARQYVTWNVQRARAA